MDALQNNLIKITSQITIEQKWIIDGDKYTGRIRQVKTFPDVETTYEHTVKHSFEPGVDLEITTMLSKTDFDMLNVLYEQVPMQRKARLFIHDESGMYDQYIITVDIPEDKPDIVWVEVESDEKISEDYKKPEWIKMD